MKICMLFTRRAQMIPNMQVDNAAAVEQYAEYKKEWSRTYLPTFETLSMTIAAQDYSLASVNLTVRCDVVSNTIWTMWWSWRLV